VIRGIGRIDGLMSNAGSAGRQNEENVVDRTKETFP
jgi:hypothetical protein